jgi:hypothetical protein
MLRYRCPQCTQLLQSHVLRAGKKSVCAACLSAHVIPTDHTIWLNASGEPLFPAMQTCAEPMAPQVTATLSQPIAHAPEPATSSIAGPPQLSKMLSTESLPSVLEAPPVAPIHVLNGGVNSPNETIGYNQTQTPHTTDEASAPLAKVGRANELANDVMSAAEPIPVQTQAQITAALTEVLTHRMKPPRQPRQDLRLSTAAWMVLTGVGVALLLLSFFVSASYASWVIGVGLLQILIGYLWITSLTAQRDPKRGMACAIPPITFYYLGQWKYAKCRPLRFVATGAVLAGLSMLASQIAPITQRWVGSGARNAAAHATGPNEMSNLDKVREYKKQKEYDKLIDLLHDLANTDSLKSVDAKDAHELAIELKSLCSHQDTGVKVAAMGAYTRWGGDDAREICLAAIQSTSQEERLMAIQLLPQWKGTDSAPTVARAVAALIGRSGVESNRAEKALVEIGGVAAELAALGLLRRTDDQQVRLIALSILEKVGGEEAQTVLGAYANTSLDQTLKTRTRETIETIRTRLNKNP